MYAAGQLTEEEFLDAVSKVCSDERIRFEKQRENIMRSAANALGFKDLGEMEKFEIDGKAVFKDLLPFEKDRLGDVMSDAGKRYDPDMANVALKLAKKHKCKTLSEYTSVLKFVARYVMKLRKNTVLKPNQSRANWEKDFLTDLLTYPTSQEFVDMNNTYSKHLETITKVNESSKYKFKCNKAAVYHFYKHNDFKGGAVDEQGYFDILNELFENKLNKRYMKLTQEGDMWRVIYTDPNRGLFGVLIRCRQVSDHSNVYVATMQYNPGFSKTNSITSVSSGGAAAGGSGGGGP
jgi:hypothetical protein